MPIAGIETPPKLLKDIINKFYKAFNLFLKEHKFILLNIFCSESP